jgi:hypothetical protein
MSLRELSLPYLVLTGMLLCFGIASAATFAWLSWTICGAIMVCLLDPKQDHIPWFIWVPIVAFSCLSFGAAQLALRQSRVAWGVGLLLVVALGAYSGFLYWLSQQSWT